MTSEIRDTSNYFIFPFSKIVFYYFNDFICNFRGLFFLATTACGLRLVGSQAQFITEKQLALCDVFEGVMAVKCEVGGETSGTARLYLW